MKSGFVFSAVRGARANLFRGVYSLTSFILILLFTTHNRSCAFFSSFFLVSFLPALDTHVAPLSILFNP